MSMGGGMSASESSSFTNSEAFSQAISEAFGVGGSNNASGSQSMVDASSFGGTFVDPMQQPFRQNLFGQAQAFSDPWGTQQAAQGASYQNAGVLDQSIGNTLGLANYQNQIDAQSASLQSGLGDLFRNEINPALQTDAIAAGGFGGGRQGVAEGVATGQLANAYTQGYGDIVANARQQGLQANAMLPGLAQARYQNAMQPYSAGLGNLSQYAAILGAPTLLSNQGSTSRDRSSSSSLGSSFNRSGSLNEAISGSKSKGGSSSESTAFNFSMGL